MILWFGLSTFAFLVAAGQDKYDKTESISYIKQFCVSEVNVIFGITEDPHTLKDRVFFTFTDYTATRLWLHLTFKLI